MREWELLYLGAGLAAVWVSLLLAVERLGAGACVIMGLAFSCAFLFRLLLQWSKRLCRFSEAVTVLAAAACFLLGPGLLFPVLAVQLAELCDALAGRRYSLSLTLAGLLLLWAVEPAELTLTAVALLTLGFVFYAGSLAERLSALRTRCGEQTEENEALREKLGDNRRLLKTLSYTARLEERNRLAARLHDKIGHGISGSLILLEGALLSMDTRPESARKTIEQAVETLRESVDEIRMELREERPGRSAAGIGEIKAQLARFSAEHAVQTELREEGRLEEIPPWIWNCILENLKEAQTNLLKHSRASAFRVRLSVTGRVARVEFADNGCASGKLIKGMGLEAMEDRTASCGGRCFFMSGEDGFFVVQIFILREE